MHNGAPAHFSRSVRDVLKNMYHSQRIGREGRPAWPPLTQKKSRFQKWVPTTSNEIRVYLGLLMLMGIIQKPNLRMYFSRKHMLETQEIGGVKWKDKRDVSVLTTKHSDEMQPVSLKGGLEFVNKPMCVIEYNKYMGGVDLKDQLLETFLLERKRQKAWYKKLFNHLVNTAALNADILYCKTGNKKDHLLFRINLVNKIIAQSHGQNLEKCKGRLSDTDMEFSISIKKIPKPKFKTERENKPETGVKTAQGHPLSLPRRLF
ncbi:hypothetical protein B7P43_G12840 [Cryptotermes secundus]|uniref:PiggyBac transposable element-derived protein domain-containing protein n=1 Tax=Cryptotermes secundus TaxID=105785 RepID=A0A2J7Q5Q6_9NEOP|nr:hypothetical protein B7P43_G12840 [Cryptotermes secundus]